MTKDNIFKYVCAPLLALSVALCLTWGVAYFYYDYFNAYLLFAPALILSVNLIFWLLIDEFMEDTP